MRSRQILYTYCLCALLCFAPTMVQAQPDTRKLVAQMVNNELNADKRASYWMFRETLQKGGKNEVDQVIEMPECWLRWPLTYDGNPPSPAQQQKARASLDRLVNDADARSQNRAAIDQDSRKSEALLKMLPDAFLYTEQGQQHGEIQLGFRPNPAFHPPTREAKVFHSMQGTLTIDAKELRLVGISGKLMSDVTFGGGLLGRLHKGGTFQVEQQEVAPGDWELSQLDVNITGKALLFKTISEQQRQKDTDFRAVPDGLSLARAASLIEQGESALASVSDLRHNP